jgi:putative SOS response-associated peptidase YedK
MCARYHSVLDASRLKQFFKIKGIADLAQDKSEVFPGQMASFVRAGAGGDGQDGSQAEVLIGVFGLLPHWTKDSKFAKSTYNARSETVSAKPAFQYAWRRAQHCIVPAEAIWEPDWRSGRCQWTRITRADGKPMGLAGLWSTWHPIADQVLHSFTLLTINADAHPFMRNYHRPADEKRMIVALPEDQYEAWLHAPADRSMDFLRPCAAEDLVADVSAAAAQLTL